MSDETNITRKTENNFDEMEDLFDNVDAVENEFSNNDEIVEMNSLGEKEFTLDDVRQSNFIKLPEVGKREVYIIEKIVDNLKTKMRNKSTGEEFSVGVTTKDKTKTIRRDIHTDKGIFTISSWGIFFKFFGKDSELMKLANDRKRRTGQSSFGGIEVTIKHNYNGNYAMKPVAEVMKLMDMTEEQAKAYKITVAKAIKENKLYTIFFRDPEALVEEDIMI